MNQHYLTAHEENMPTGSEKRAERASNVSTDTHDKIPGLQETEELERRLHSELINLRVQYADDHAKILAGLGDVRDLDSNHFQTYTANPRNNAAQARARTAQYRNQLRQLRNNRSLPQLQQDVTSAADLQKMQQNRPLPDTGPRLGR